ncbi:MAG: hypothetical protein KatS3mg110_2452 [Pirellulaceae bacterium]|nr:MAG: hypothetical protein KatS3mg110_2452 [Pirellulaceae bacterium]
MSGRDLYSSLSRKGKSSAGRFGSGAFYFARAGFTRKPPVSGLLEDSCVCHAFRWGASRSDWQSAENSPDSITCHASPRMTAVAVARWKQRPKMPDLSRDTGKLSQASLSPLGTRHRSGVTSPVFVKPSAYILTDFRLNTSGMVCCTTTYDAPAMIKIATLPSLPHGQLGLCAHLMLLVALLLGCRDDQIKHTPKIMDVAIVDIGAGQVGTSFECSSVLRNRSRSDLVFEQAEVGCGCVFVQLDPRVVRPGRCAKLSVRGHRPSGAGEFEYSAFLMFRVGESQRRVGYLAIVRGKAEPWATIIPAEVDFGDVIPGRAYSRKIVVNTQVPYHDIEVESSPLVAIKPSSHEPFTFTVTLITTSSDSIPPSKEYIVFCRRSNPDARIAVPIIYRRVRSLFATPERVVVVRLDSDGRARGKVIVTDTGSISGSRPAVSHTFHERRFSCELQPLTDKQWVLSWEYVPEEGEGYWSGQVTVSTSQNSITIPFVGVGAGGVTKRQ